MELPRGAQTDIARRLGISPRWANVILTDLGAVCVNRAPRFRFQCHECGAAYVRRKQPQGWGALFCSVVCRRENTWLRLTCSRCGKEFRRTSGDVRRFPPKDGDLFCSVPCANARFAGVPYSVSRPRPLAST
jgi:hypothetical protein